MHTDLAARVRDAAPTTRTAVITLLIALVAIISWFSVEFRPSGAVIAFWWPAAAVAAAAMIMARGRRLATAAGVFVAVFLANALVGRPVELVAGYALANTAAAYVVALVATRGGSYATIRTARSAGRFVLAATAGGATIAVLGAASAWAFAGADFVAAALALFPSHASALLVLTPLVLVEWRWRAMGSGAEAIVQTFVFVGVVVVAHSPLTVVPLGFATIAALLWAGFRLPMPLLAAQLATLGIVATTATAYGFGTYSGLAEGDPRIDVMVVQANLIVHACAALLIAASRAEWSAAAAGIAASEALLRGGLLGLETGIVIGEVVGGKTLRILQMNAPALRALGLSPEDARERAIALDAPGPVLGAPAIDEVVRQLRSAALELDTEAGHYDVDVTVHSGPTGASILTVVFTDVTARDERERAALATAEQLRDLNRHKDAFIAAVSHELRTPVTAILGFAEELADAALPAAEQQAAMIIDRNARRLAAVIDDVLELSRLTNAAPSGRPAVEADVTAVVCMACDDAAGLAPAKHVAIVKDFTAHPRPVITVRPDLERVMANLLSNAVKFSPVRGTITVSVVEDADGFEVRIVDEGPGIPTDELDRVWERFYRLQDDAHRDVPGTGLGLPIVRSLVERRLGGEVRLESDGATGTTAVLRIPSEAPTEAPPAGSLPIVDAQA